jgi:chloramphenicol O-acetyltransferase type B
MTRIWEPYAIVGGNPGKVIRKHFDEPEIIRLRELRWWNRKDIQLREAMPILTGGNVQALHDHRQTVVKVYCQP